jgi:hypothetical protein
VFLSDFESFGSEAGWLADVETDTLTDTGAIINALPLKAGAYRNRKGLRAEPQRDGLDLSPPLGWPKVAARSAIMLVSMLKKPF